MATSPEPTRLGLLVAAESAGALAAAEMTYAGVPWRVEVHDRLLSDLLGPRPPRGGRPLLLDSLVEEVRRELDSPALNPDSRPDLISALRRAGLDVADVRASTLRDGAFSAMLLRQTMRGFAISAVVHHGAVMVNVPIVGSLRKLSERLTEEGPPSWSGWRAFVDAT